MVDFKPGDKVRRIKEHTFNMRIGEVHTIVYTDDKAVFLVGFGTFGYLKKYFELVEKFSNKSGFSRFINKVESNG